MSSVRNIANHNRTVVCTIHSPSEAVYNLFDSLLLLALGRQTYFGPVSDAPAYFSQVNLGWCMPVGKNPADFIMEANQGLLTAADGSRRTIRELNQLFLNSTNYMGVEAVIDKVLLAKAIQQQREGERGSSDGNVNGQGRTAVAEVPRRIRSDSVMATLFKPERYPRSTLAQTYILSHRQFRKAWKMVCRESVLVREESFRSCFGTASSRDDFLLVTRSHFHSFFPSSPSLIPPSTAKRHVLQHAPQHPSGRIPR